MEVQSAILVHCGATTTREELTPLFETIVEKVGVPRTFVCSDASSSNRSSAFGVFLRSAHIDGADIVYLLNLNPTNKKDSSASRGRAGVAVPGPLSRQRFRRDRRDHAEAA